VFGLSPKATIPILNEGGLIAYPTEAVWGLGCDPANETAVMRLLALKQRPVEKGLIVVAADIAQLHGWANLDALPESRRQAVLNSWPGAQTWVLPKAGTTPHWITGQHPGIAVRISAHPIVQALCRAFNAPLVSTSANLAGAPPPRQYKEMAPALLAQLDAIVTGEVGSLAQPTPIRDALTGQRLR